MPTYDDKRWAMARQLGPRLARERRERGWSLRELKDQLEQVTGMVRSVSSLQRLEAGEQPPRVDEWLALSQLFEKSAVAMLGQDDFADDARDLVRALFDASSAVETYSQQATDAMQRLRDAESELYRMLEDRPELRAVVDDAADQRLGPFKREGPPLSERLAMAREADSNARELKARTPRATTTTKQRKQGEQHDS